MIAAPGGESAQKRGNMKIISRSDRGLISACQRVLKENGLHDWRVEIEDRQGSWAKCLSEKKLIRISKLETWIREGFSLDKIMDTIYHEVAHALNPLRDRHTWPAKQIKTKDGSVRYRIVSGSVDRSGHNLTWARIAIRLGCKPELGATEWQRKVLAKVERNKSQRRA